MPSAASDLDVAQHIPVEAEAAHRLAARVLHHQIDDVVAHCSADQELQREIANPLDILFVVALLRLDPAADEPVANGERQRVIPVLIGRGVLVLGEGAPEMKIETADQAVRIHPALLPDDAQLSLQGLVRLCDLLKFHVLVSQLALIA